MRNFICLCVALLWWGFLYPEFTFNQDTYEVVREEENQTENEEASQFDENIFEKICKAPKGTVHIRSKLWKALSTYFKEINSNESGN